MSYRLDQGCGTCIYHIGVEDDGCHSLLDYNNISESAWILESIARNLNSVVVSRRMIQNEIVVSVAKEEENESGNYISDKDGVFNGTFSNNDQHDVTLLKLTDDLSNVVIVEEPSVLGRGDLDTEENNYDICREHEDEKDDKDQDANNINNNNKTGNKEKKKKKLCTEEGTYTRCELTIQRIETHLLDPSPLSLSSLSRTSSSVSSSSYNGEGTKVSVNGQGGRGGSPSKEKGANGLGEEEPVATTTDNPNSGDKPISVEETLSSRNVRVAVVGNVDAGKSTLIGTLTTSFLDDGRGSSRTSIMKHRHEIESGRTSTSSSHLLGFRQSGETIAGRDKIRSNKMKSEDEIARASYRVITLMDLAGHEKYLKTTIHGVSSGMADYGLILVNSRHPPTHMTQHHLNLCCSYGIPVIVVFTKIDGCPEHALSTSKKELTKLLKSPDIGKRPFAIKNEQDVDTCIGKLHTLAPLIDISCVNGEGLDLLRKLLFTLPKRRRHEKKVNRPFEFLVEDVFNNVPGVGSVVSGFVNAGELSVGTTQVYVGPTDDGTFLKTVAKSAHIARINTARITAGQSATLAFSLNKEMRKKLRRGMVVMTQNPTSTKEFDAEICVLK